MQEEGHMGYYSSFVVKIWVNDGNSEGMLRGHIQHVGSRENVHFLNLDKMLEFIMGHLNSTANDVAAPSNKANRHSRTQHS